MTRQYRGKRVDNGEWIYGYYFHCIDYDKDYIIPLNRDETDDGRGYFYQGNVEVVPSSVGQFIGSQDIHGIDIYDKDIIHKSTENGVWGVKYGYFGEPCFKVHNYINSGRDIENDCGDIYFSWDGTEKIAIEIIGNEIDNPELIKG